MPATINTFRNVRARLHRAGAETWISGWVIHLAREEARVRLWSLVPLAKRERVVCECYGQGTVARFGGVVVGQAGKDVAIDLVGSISYTPSDETPRICAAGVSGTLAGDGVRADMLLLDVSLKSLGAMTDSEFQVGQALSMEIPRDSAAIRAKVTVANCRAEPDDPGHFRVGLHLVDIGRLDRARWSRLVEESAEA